jgi:tetratricopeptide (TPR) repeat protein
MSDLDSTDSAEATRGPSRLPLVLAGLGLLICLLGVVLWSKLKAPPQSRAEKMLNWSPKPTTAKGWVRRAQEIEAANAPDAVKDEGRLIAYSRAIELDPDLAEAYVGRADLLLLIDPQTKDSRRQSLADARAAVRLAPQSNEALWVLGAVLLDSREFAEAVKVFSAAIELGVDLSHRDANEKETNWQGTFTRGQIRLGTCFVFRGDARVGLGEYQEALKDYERSLELGYDEELLLLSMRDLAKKAKLPELERLIDKRELEIEAAMEAYRSRSAASDTEDD